jgi:hypothetical protein
MKVSVLRTTVVLTCLLSSACGPDRSHVPPGSLPDASTPRADGSAPPPEDDASIPELPPDSGVTPDLPEPPDPYQFANGCYALRSDNRYLSRTVAGDGYTWDDNANGAAGHFFMKAAELGVYLLYDQERRYVTAEQGILRRESALAK